MTPRPTQRRTETRGLIRFAVTFYQGRTVVVTNAGPSWAAHGWIHGKGNGFGLHH